MSKYECPRCGSGVKPNDIQCDRCGEMLKMLDPRKSREDDMPSNIVIDKIISEEQTSIRLDSSDFTSLSKLRKMLEEKDKEISLREKVLIEKEKRMQDTFDKMEKDQNQLEDSVKQFESDQMMIKSKEKSIREKEQELELMSEKFDKGIQEIMSLEDKLKSSRITASDVQKLDDIRKKYGAAMEHEKLKLKKALEDEFEEKLTEKERLATELKLAKEQLGEATKKIVELQRLVKAEILPFTTGEKMEVEEAWARADIKAKVAELLKVVRPDLDSQIGAGIPASGPDRTVHTHIEKFDTILGGGIPEGHVILVNGAPGTMKSSLTYTILHNAALYDGVSSMYFSLEQSRASILRQMARLKMPEPHAAENMMVVDMVDLRKEMEDIRGDWRDILLRYVKNVFAERPFRIFVLDSLDSFKAITDHDFTRQDLKDLFDWFKSLGITVMLISEKPMDQLLESVQGELYLADGAIELMMKQIDESKIQRWVRCPKLRGMNIDTRYYALFHDGEHFNLTIPIVDS
ncbi:MAG: ATPase domain-containing protein [Methanomassiliicoccales archaeon]|jgi:KaiC/GvpD/RAD55 family RecA-like ATPase